MKLRFINALLISLILTSCITNQSKDYNLKGKIKSYTSIKYQAVEKFGKIEKGNKIPRSSNQSSMDIDISENCIVKFDNSNSIYEILIFDKYGDTDYKILKSDTVSDIYNSRGIFKNKIIKNDIDFPTISNLYDSDGDLLRKKISSYNEKMELLNEKVYNHQGDLIRQSDFEYNDKGLLIKKSSTEQKRISSYYSSRRKKLKEIISIVHYKYNENNDISRKESSINDEVSLYTYKYKYDEMNNWIERTKFDKIKAISIVDREIEYYQN